MEDLPPRRPASIIAAARSGGGEEECGRRPPLEISGGRESARLGPKSARVPPCSSRVYRCLYGDYNGGSKLTGVAESALRGADKSFLLGSQHKEQAVEQAQDVSDSGSDLQTICAYATKMGGPRMFVSVR